MAETGAANLKVVREGFFRWIEKRVSSEVTCTTTYIEDAGKRILVDVPHAGEEAEFLKALLAHDVHPASIDIVVVTHHHPDHVGCLHLFPNALHVGFGVTWRGARHDYWHDETLPLTDDVYVLKTPGHTPDSVSVIVNASDGRYAVVGDMWWSLEDPKLLVVSDAEALRKSRERVIALADTLIPGHGPAGPSSTVEM